MRLDPKTIVDSIADGAMEVAEGPVRAANNLARVAEQYSASVKANMDEVKSQMPDNPWVIPKVIVKSVGQTAHAGIDGIQAITGAFDETLSAVKTQIKRVTGG